MYGTLRRDSGSPAHDWLVQRADYFGAAWIQGRLYRIAHYPGLVLSDDPADRVSGELYALREPETVLTALDRYEECGPGFAEPTEYVRRQQAVRRMDGSECAAWVYVYNWPVTEAARILSGDFVHSLAGPKS